MVVACLLCHDTGIIIRKCSCKSGNAILADDKKCGYCNGTGIRFDYGNSCDCIVDGISRRTFITDMFRS